MSNETFEHLYKKFENMIRVFIKKYKGLLEEEDIRQCCCLAIVKSHKTYKDNRNTKFSNWVYNNMNWECLRQLRSIKHQDRNCVSLQTALFDAEGKEITLEDTLIDDRVDIEAQVYDGMVKDIYKREIEKYIDGKKLDVCILRWFNNCSYKYISTVTEINNVSGILMDARATLIRRSPLLRAEFFKLHGMDSYSDAARVVI